MELRDAQRARLDRRDEAPVHVAAHRAPAALVERRQQAVPQPRLVVAVGACAISGGLFRGSDQCNKGVTDLLPVDLFIPGCPPNPWTILDGLTSLQK